MVIKYLGAKRVSGVLGTKTPAEVGSVYEHFDCSQQVSASAWNDQEGSNNLTVSGATVNSASQNGYDTLQLDGASDTITKTSGRTSSPTASFSWALVVRTPASTDDTNGESFCRTSGSSNDYVSMNFNSYMTGIKVETAWAVGADSCKITDTNFLDEWIVLIATFTHGGKIRLYAGRNGDATELKSTSNNDYDTTDNTVGLGTALYLGVNGGNNNMYFDGHYAEVISFNKALSASEAEQLGAHLLYKWGITSTNPQDKASLLITTIQGYDGGDIGSPSSGAGGGGASEVGESETSGQSGGDGGDGLQNDITGTNTYYAGGGGGSPHSGSTGSGGQGGGGDGINNTNGEAGTANTGGGGGGGGEVGANRLGGAGGSGIVIIRGLTSELSGNYSTSGSPTVTTDGSYTVVKYLSSGTFVPTTSFNVEYLVVGGGGSGGGGIGGGGGAGGYLAATGYTVTAQSYTVTVGAGGAQQSGDNAAGVNGADSVFGSITALGGGFGSGELDGSTGDQNGGNGASGGGAAGSNRLGGDGTSTTTSNLPAGSIFIETDTYKYFNLDSGKDVWLNRTDGDYLAGIVAGGTGYNGSGAPTGHTASCNSTASTWTAQTAKATSASGIFGGGGKADHISGAGEDYSGSTKYTLVEKFNGSAWSTLGSLAKGKSSTSGGGNSSDAINFGGHDGSTNGGNWTEEWDGSAWSAGGNMTRGSRSGGGDGNSTNALSAGGYRPTSPAGYDTQTMEYNGTAWADTTTATIAADNFHGGMGGNATNAVLTAGNAGKAYTYNGSAWATAGVTSTDRRYGQTGGSATTAITGGGSDVVNSSHYLDTSDFFNGTAWASAGTVPYRKSYGDGGFA